MAVRAVEIRREHYYSAAFELFSEVERLRAVGHGNSPLAAYLCGVAIECSLRSLVPSETPFYDRHDFSVLARLGARNVADETEFSRMIPLISEVSQIWKKFAAVLFARTLCSVLSSPKPIAWFTSWAPRAFNERTLPTTL